MLAVGVGVGGCARCDRGELSVAAGGVRVVLGGGVFGRWGDQAVCWGGKSMNKYGGTVGR